VNHAFALLFAIHVVTIPSVVVALEERADPRQPSAETVRDLIEQVALLRKEVDQLKQQLAKDRFKLFQTERPKPETAAVPGVMAQSPLGIVNDLKCRQALSFKDEDLRERRANCEQLSPWTRLALGNLSAGVSGIYTNIAGSPNIGADLPIVETATTAYQVGIGYKGKPILIHMRALFDGDTEKKLPSVVANQGTPSEDFVFNAVQLNAGVSYGRTLKTKDTIGIRSGNSRPVYSVALTYSIDLERAWAHILERAPNARPVDPGYVYKAGCPGFWNGEKCGKGSALDLDPLNSR
jgi:hypothetical protein